ncbi:tRNA pseudouridine(55) synthase TruB [Candidatus Methylocalor cossyra]|uniref:tRNA pseudouridine synthase B n=1 Tax=Candidatus Methylocalor cossyra TaxID=3108543 RepID=A0ABP1C6V7_9GAMM
MNRKPSLKTVDGVLLLDKTPGFTSNAALQRAKRLLGARKAGHTGSLDPIASGLLPLCFGEATKLSGFLLNTDKRYRVQVRLGVTTTTGDAEGAITATQPVPPLTEAQIEATLAAFRGEIFQVPPMFSALKQGGRRLYELAREGLEVRREPRRVTLYELRLEGFDGSVLDLSVHCSKGTYIRTLAEDIGRALGCGGHVQALRRTAVGDLEVRDAHTLDQLEALAEGERSTLLLPMDHIVARWPAVQLNELLSFYVRKGEAVQVPRAPKEGWVRLYHRETVFLGVGEVLDDGRIAPRRLVKPRPKTGPSLADRG